MHCTPKLANFSFCFALQLIQNQNYICKLNSDLEVKVSILFWKVYTKHRKVQ